MRTLIPIATGLATTLTQTMMVTDGRMPMRSSAVRTRLTPTQYLTIRIPTASATRSTRTGPRPASSQARYSPTQLSPQEAARLAQSSTMPLCSAGAPTPPASSGPEGAAPPRRNWIWEPAAQRCPAPLDSTLPARYWMTAR